MTSVLVLDDRTDDRELLATVLTYAGYRVIEAATGEAALDLIRTERPDLVIADILMPTMDGYDFVQRVRAEPSGRDLPVMFCTATYEVDEVRRLAQAFGVSQILVKPSEPEQIMRVVGKALDATPELVPRMGTAQLDRDRLAVLNRKLVDKVAELEEANHEQRRLTEKLGKAERRTAESLTLLETLQSTAPVGFGFVDREFRMRRVNATLAAINGMDPDEQLGRTVAEVVPELWSQIEPAYRQVLDTGTPVMNVEIAGPTPAAPAEVHSWLASFYPVRLDDEVIGIGVVVVDITERREEEEFRSVVLDNMAEGLCATDSEGNLSFMNAAASRMLGWTEEDLRGKSMHEALHFQHADGSPYPIEECELLKSAARGNVRTHDDAFTCRDGSILPVACSAAPLIGRNGVPGMVVVFRDISEEKAEQVRAQRELDALSWVGRIRDALDTDRMVLYAQPIVALAGGAPSEELLLRMLGPSGEIIAPMTFLPVAEKYGLIAEIDRWVVGQAVRRAAAGHRVEANLSAESVGSADLLPVIERELRASAALPSDLVFEITETALMRDVEAGEAFARGLADIGCGLAIDDFGTGFGSFTYLKRLPAQYVKIDIEFVHELASSPENQHVVRAIVSLAHGFGQQTIAEGVEDPETLELLREFGVDFAQGFHLGRPAPMD